MFTGLIEGTGTLLQTERHGQDARMIIRPDFQMGPAVLGESISVDGACLTVIDAQPDLFTADVSTETLSRTVMKDNREKIINGIIDNTLFRLELHEYTLASQIVSLWRKVVVKDWESLYGVKPYGFETFVEYAEIDANRQRVGSLYLADNWTLVGETAGNTRNHIGKGLTGGLHGNPFTRENVSKSSYSANG